MRTRPKVAFFCAVVALLGVAAVRGIHAVPPAREASMPDEYRELARQISDLTKQPTRDAQPRLRAEVLRQESLILDSDRDPLDVVLRRTGALAKLLSASDSPGKVSRFATELAALTRRADAVPASESTAREALYIEAIRLRRKIAFSNPLLNFDKILFVKHDPCGRTEAQGNHMCDQYFGFNAVHGGGLFVLNNPFNDSPALENILSDSVVSFGRLAGQKLSFTDGSFLTPSLSYDGKTIVFAYTQCGLGAPKSKTWSQEWSWHIFKVNVDGTGLTQITDGQWNDFSPCWMPDGNITFISDRRGGFGRCHGRPVPSYTLHNMLADGSGLQTISFHETNEWHPSVNNDGMVVYTRWDYVDRDSDIAHHLWVCYPDGRDPRSFHGNYPLHRELRPWMEMSIRAIPQSQKYVAVAAPHHGQAYGTLVCIDQRPEDDGAMSQIKRITPEVHMPESESAPGIPNRLDAGKASGGEVYGTPWPLSEDFYLCVRDTGQRHYGIYLVDSFGNRELLYQSTDTACLSPIPLRPQPRPPVMPPAAVDPKADQTGRIAVMDVYRGDQKWPAGTKITALRVVQLYPKETPNVDEPKIGIGAQSLARGVLGTVPVESDGSAYFEAPAGVPFYFQALDENGLGIQTMQSDTYLHPGETLTCGGCHETKRSSMPDRTSLPLALRRPPSKLQPDVSGSQPLLYPALVQPVLDRHCVSCHQKSKGAPDLTGGRSTGDNWSPSYRALSKLAWALHGGNGAIATNGSSRSTPGKVGARASKLLAMLSAGHHGVKLPPEDLHRITLWMDCNSVFFGAYRETGKQLQGQVVLPQLR